MTMIIIKEKERKTFLMIMRIIILKVICLIKNILIKKEIV